MARFAITMKIECFGMHNDENAERSNLLEFFTLLQRDLCDIESRGYDHPYLMENSGVSVEFTELTE